VIAFDVTPLQNGHRTRGIGTYVRGLAAQLLQQQEIPIEFWGWADDRPFEVHPPHRALWLPRGIVPRTRFPFLLRQAMLLRRRLSRARAFHITDPNALADRGVMSTVYDLIPLHRRDAVPAYKRYLERLKSASVLFAISQTTADDVVGSLGVVRDKVVIARPGVVLPDLSTPAEPPRASGPFFLYYGSPDPHKNLQVLVDAMKSTPDLKEKLVVAGDWPRTFVDRLLAEPIRVEHLGYVSPDQLLALQRACTAVVMPSLLEGFGLPVAEAMAAGAAVIHSRLLVLEEVSAGAALTFDPASPDELGACLRSVSLDADLRQDLQARGRRRAESLTWEEAIKNTLRVYREALDN
jgi:glycosyltransferase involved in cell wall biosynthesis